MQDNKYTLIVNYPVLAAGGIEQSLAAMMKFFLDDGHRVIWITTNQHIKNVAFPELLNDPRLEIVFSKWSRIFGTPRISLQEDERVIMLTCQALKYVVSEGIRRKAKTKNFMHYYVVAHFTGSIYYPELGWENKLLKRIAFRFWKKILQRIVDQDCILGFGPKHLQCYEEHYGVSIPNPDKRLVPNYQYEKLAMDMDTVQKKCAQRDSKFIITTCSRLEFPHKAYVLGLIDNFAAVKQQYPQAVLQIIGYGSGEHEVQSQINSLPENIRKDIELIGMVSPETLKEYYKKAHLVVGLAGSAITGALCGTPTLLVRHYCRNCETYGFFADAPDKTLCEDKGESIIPYITSCIEMDIQSYTTEVERAFDALSYFVGPAKDSFFQNYKEHCPLVVKDPCESLLGWLLHVMYSIGRRLNRRETI